MFLCVTVPVRRWLNSIDRLKKEERKMETEYLYILIGVRLLVRTEFKLFSIESDKLGVLQILLMW